MQLSWAITLQISRVKLGKWREWEGGTDGEMVEEGGTEGGRKESANPSEAG